MIFQECGSEELVSIKALYQEMNWLAYLHDDERLRKAFDNSLYVLGAFEEGNLIGFVRCVGDGEHIVLVQDLIVAKAYQRQGIGTKLLQAVWDKYLSVRAFQLTTDLSDDQANHFYQSIGMQEAADKQLVTYFR